MLCRRSVALLVCLLVVVGFAGQVFCASSALPSPTGPVTDLVATLLSAWASEGAGEGKAGTPTPYHDALNGPPNIFFRNDGHGRFVEVTDEVGLDAGNDRFSFSAAWGDYDGDGWPDLVVTNDFGRKNLYHNLGLRDGKVRFEDVSARAGVEDYAAGERIWRRGGSDSSETRRSAFARTICGSCASFVSTPLMAQDRSIARACMSRSSRGKICRTQDWTTGPKSAWAQRSMRHLAAMIPTKPQPISLAPRPPARFPVSLRVGNAMVGKEWWMLSSVG